MNVIEREQIDKLAHCIMGATDCEFNLEQSRRMVTLVFAAMDFIAAREARNDLTFEIAKGLNTGK